MNQKRQATKIDNLSNDFTAYLAEFSPSFATSAGIPGHESKMDDHSPDATEGYFQKLAVVRKELEALTPKDEVDEVSKDALDSSLKMELELHQAGLTTRDLNNLASPAQGVRDIFDLSATATETDWENITARLNRVTQALEGYMETLRLGASKNDTAAKRQIEAVIAQAKQITAKNGFFTEFASNAKTESGELSDSLKKELVQASDKATAGYAKFESFLSEELLPQAKDIDAIGEERYQLLSQRFLGTKVDLHETYEWGIEELARVVAEQQRVANEILPGASVQEVVAHLDTDPAKKLMGTEALREWMQQVSDDAIQALAGKHFDIAEPLKTLECMIAPTQHGVIYYTGPSDDFSRPGRMWWSVPEGVTEFNTWREKTTVYHEGVPGHHLQVAQQVYIKDMLNDWRRLASWTSGHGEGWALYAERLMADLGFLDDPADRLGMLDGQRMRAARVVLDIGVHLGKNKLTGSGKWDYDYALEFMMQNVNMPKPSVEFEVMRYFGWPGQAPSYKIGQRIWEQVLDQYATRKGSDFDIKTFHMTALNLGGIGLSTLQNAMARA